MDEDRKYRQRGSWTNVSNEIRGDWGRAARPQAAARYHWPPLASYGAVDNGVPLF